MIIVNHFCVPSSHEAARGNMKSIVDDLGVPPAQDFQLHRLSGSAAGIMSAVTFLGKPEDEVLQAVQRLVACVTST